MWSLQAGRAGVDLSSPRASILLPFPLSLSTVTGSAITHSKNPLDFGARRQAKQVGKNKKEQLKKCKPMQSRGALCCAMQLYAKS